MDRRAWWAVVRGFAKNQAQTERLTLSLPLLFINWAIREAHTPYKVIITFWLYSLCCILYPVAYFILKFVLLNPLHQFCICPKLVLLVTTSLFCLSQSVLVLLKVKVKSLSPVRLFSTPRPVIYQAPQSMEFSRQVYWSGLWFPSPYIGVFMVSGLKFNPLIHLEFVFMYKLGGNVLISFFCMQLTFSTSVMEEIVFYSLYILAYFVVD